MKAALFLSLIAILFLPLGETFVMASSPALRGELAFYTVGQTSTKQVDQNANGNLVLDAKAAQITGSITVEGDSPANLGGWLILDDYASWTFKVAKTGKYRVEITYSLDPNSSGTLLSLNYDTQKLEIRPHPTDDWTTYRTAKVGEISLDNPGSKQIDLKVLQKSSTQVPIVNIRQIALYPEGSPSQVEDMLPPVTAQSDGSFALTPLNGEIVGNDALIENKVDIGSWTKNTTYPHWIINVKNPGQYQVSWTYATGPGCGGSDMNIRFEGASTLHTTPDQTKGWDDYQEAKIGKITFEKPGTFDVTVKTPEFNGGFVMNLKLIKLVPIPQTGSGT